MKTINVNGQNYEWCMDKCIDCDEFAVSLDLGNGRPECIGYTSSEAEAKEMVSDELEALLAS